MISEDFEDCSRTSVSIGGDTDTLCAISCAAAEAFYGIPEKLHDKALAYLDKRLLKFTINIIGNRQRLFSFNFLNLIN